MGDGQTYVTARSEAERYLARRRAANGAGSAMVAQLAALYAHDTAWFGPHPLNDLDGRAAVEAVFLQPLIAAAPHLERREDITLTGLWSDGAWVASTGHDVGLFADDWLGLPTKGRLLSLRYGEFVRLAGGQVRETYVLIDFLDVMRQLGLWPLAPALGSVERIPGPATHDGVRAGEADPDESRASLALVEAMIGGLMRYDRATLSSMQQERYWDVSRMMWYGPAGIGTARGLLHYQAVHQRPFLTAFPDRVGGNHKCRIAEGPYVASTGWPSVRATHLGGGFLGLPPSGRAVGMRVMDFWRCADGLIRENWVFIDLPDLLLQMDLDVFGRAGLSWEGRP